MKTHKLMHLNLDLDTYARITAATETLKRRYGRASLGCAAVVTELAQKHLPPAPATRRTKRKPAAAEAAD